VTKTHPCVLKQSFLKYCYISFKHFFASIQRLMATSPPLNSTMPIMGCHHMPFPWQHIPRQKTQCCLKSMEKVPNGTTLQMTVNGPALNSSTPIMGCHHVPFPCQRILRHKTQCCLNSMEKVPNCTRLQMTVNGPALNSSTPILGCHHMPFPWQRIPRH